MTALRAAHCPNPFRLRRRPRRPRSDRRPVESPRHPPLFNAFCAPVISPASCGVLSKDQTIS
eukprot:2319877-Pyramimonas_sp.AAC.1